MNMNRGYAIASAIAIVTTVLAASEARAWDPPDGPFVDIANTPAPGTLVPKAHGYIIQTGISILYNDGYWFAAQMLQNYQQELLNGVRYADKYLGDQNVEVKECVPLTNICTDIASLAHWGLAADNHYYNPDTGIGLNPPNLEDISTWTAVLQFLGITIVPGLRVVTDPPFNGPYTSALVMMNSEYTNAMNAFAGITTPPIGNRVGRPLAMFYLGWASHFMQDLNVVHHTFDEPRRHHNEYEAFADGRVTSPPDIRDTAMRGIYFKNLPVAFCEGWERTPMCFAAWAAQQSHVADILNRADAGDYTSGFQVAIPRAQRLQAGLYAKYLTDVGLAPVHLSAVMPVLRML